MASLDRGRSSYLGFFHREESIAGLNSQVSIGTKQNVSESVGHGAILRRALIFVRLNLRFCRWLNLLYDKISVRLHTFDIETGDTLEHH